MKANNKNSKSQAKRAATKKAAASTPKKKRTSRRSNKRGIIAKLTPLRVAGWLTVLLLASFLLSGGIAILLPQTWQGIGDFMPAAPRQKPANQLLLTEQTGLADTDFTDKLLRFIFIRRAVNARLDRENYAPLRQISTDLQHAIVAVEDNRFYHHLGFDIEAIMRATLVNIQYGRIEEGASTITQQLVKNLFLSSEQSWGRKLEELLLALDLEATYSKDEILEMYLNTIYYGNGYYGVTTASEGYFALPPTRLELAESAMLAGIPNAPSDYSPFVDYMLAKKRQDLVLDIMHEKGYITEREAEDAKIKPLQLRPNGSTPISP